MEDIKQIVAGLIEVREGRSEQTRRKNCQKAIDYLMAQPKMRVIEIKEVKSRSGWKPEGEVITSSYGGGLFPATDAIEKLKKWCNFEPSGFAGDILIIERDTGKKRN